MTFSHLAHHASSMLLPIKVIFLTSQHVIDKEFGATELKHSVARLTPCVLVKLEVK